MKYILEKKSRAKKSLKRYLVEGPFSDKTQQINQEA